MTSQQITDVKRAYCLLGKAFVILSGVVKENRDIDTVDQQNINNAIQRTGDAQDCISEIIEND